MKKRIERGEQAGIAAEKKRAEEADARRDDLERGAYHAGFAAMRKELRDKCIGTWESAQPYPSTLIAYPRGEAAALRELARRIERVAVAAMIAESEDDDTKRKGGPSMIPTHHHCIVASKQRGPAPTPAVHPSREIALDEAERLAKAHPQDEFVVYEAIAVVKITPPVIVTMLEGNGETQDSDIPF